MIIIIWFELPAISLWPNLEYRTHSQFFIGNWIVVGLSPYELIENSFNPSLKPIATLNVNGWTSIELGSSFWLKLTYHINILSKEVELKCSKVTAFNFFSRDKINKIFFVGNTAISKISLINNIHPKIDWMGDRKVSTSVSWSNILNTMGNIFPGGRRWLERVDLDVKVGYVFWVRY